MSIDPRFDDSPRACRDCDAADVHPRLTYSCGACYMDWRCEWETNDGVLAADAEDLGEPVVTIECEEPRTSSGEWTLDISDIGTVDINGNVVGVT